MGKDTLKAINYMPTFAGLALEPALESADFSPESANSRADGIINGRRPVSNMFKICLVPQLADS